MTLELVQRIVDHFYIGKVVSFEKTGEIIWIETAKKKKFVVLEGGFDRLETEQTRLAKVGKKVERCLREDYLGKLNPDTSYAHVRGKYYSVYNILNED